MELTFENTTQLYMKWFKGKGRSSSNLEQRERVLKLFFVFLESRGLTLISEIRQEDLKAYMEWRAEAINRYGRQNGHAQRNAEITAVNDIFVVLSKMDLFVPSEPLHLPQVKAPGLKLPKESLKTRDIVKVLKLLDVSLFDDLMIRTILELLIATGMRKTEVEKLRVGDIQLKERRVVIRDTKTKIDRVVPINFTCAEVLAMYLKVFKKKINVTSDTILFQKDGEPLPYGLLIHRLKILGERANLKYGLQSRMFRHWVATRLVKKGMKVRCVQELLGHTSLDTTMVYVQIENVKVERELRKRHPRA